MHVFCCVAAANARVDADDGWLCAALYISDCSPTLLHLPCSEWEGIYVLYTYAAKRQTAKNIQLLLSKPEAGSEGKLLRHITLFKC